MDRSYCKAEPGPGWGEGADNDNCREGGGGRQGCVCGRVGVPLVDAIDVKQYI